MEEQLELFEEETEKTCFDCVDFFPTLIDGPTADGICLKDKEFEPFIDELLGKENYACCLELIKRKKFDGNRDACPAFEQAETESIEIDESTPFGRDLVAAVESGEFDKEKLQQLIFEEQIRRIDFKTLPVERYLEDLRSPVIKKRNGAIASLGALAIQGNEAAFRELLVFLEDLPQIETIDDVHLRLMILRHLERQEFRPLMTSYLLDQLEHVPSNNTTRQWISRILDFFKFVPLEYIQEPLEDMMRKGRFSYRLKQRVKELLYYHTIEW